MNLNVHDTDFGRSKRNGNFLKRLLPDYDKLAEMIVDGGGTYLEAAPELIVWESTLNGTTTEAEKL